MKKLSIIILIFVVAGGTYVGFLLFVGGNKQTNTVDNVEQSQPNLVNNGGEVIDESSVGGGTSTESSGIVIDKDLLNRKIQFSTTSSGKNSNIGSSTSQIASSSSQKTIVATGTTEVMATSTSIISTSSKTSIISSSTLPVKRATSTGVIKKSTTTVQEIK